jgi:hypothetical protein
MNPVSLLPHLVCRRAAISDEKEENLKQYRRKERKTEATTGKERI